MKKFPDYADPDKISKSELEARLRVSVVHTEIKVEYSELMAKMRSGTPLNEKETLRLSELDGYISVFNNKELHIK